jgi:hypothetical protein
MDFELEVNLAEVKSVIEHPDFAQYLLSHTTSFGAAAFILQTLLDAVDAAATSVDNEENV